MRGASLLFSLLIFALAGCAQAPNRKTSSLDFRNDLVHKSIFNGKPVAAGGQSWKSTVKLSYTHADGHYTNCTGVFVEEDVLLTAAHCKVNDNEMLTVSLYMGNSKEPKYLFLEKGDYRYHGHPKYRPLRGFDLGTNDIAVIILKTARLPDGFEAAPLQTASLVAASDPGQAAMVVGAGLNEKNVNPDHLYFAQGTISSYLSEGLVTIDFPNRSGVCGGDSGGPVFVTSQGRLYLSAITTSSTTNLGIQCGNTLTANVITGERYRWIERKIQDQRDMFENSI